MTKEKIISLAVETGIAIQDEIVAAIAEPPTWNQMEAFYHAAQAEAFESAAVKSWIHYMDTCKRLKRSPADNEEWLCATAIREMAKEKQNAD